MWFLERIVVLIHFIYISFWFFGELLPVFNIRSTERYCIVQVCICLMCYRLSYNCNVHQIKCFSKIGDGAKKGKRNDPWYPTANNGIQTGLNNCGVLPQLLTGTNRFSLDQHEILVNTSCYRPKLKCSLTLLHRIAWWVLYCVTQLWLFE